MSSNLTALQIQLEILRLIPKTRFITAEEILQKLADIGVQRDIRSIQRQLESLSQQFEIERDCVINLMDIDGNQMLKAWIYRF